eukprot:c9033_g1_i3.p1 GENE.c9033_g1_i3~~c9033_g1_i3.p1  ORF type:complete len:737 (+),score=156.85 c9033_g1_i3:177-2213(+)
MVACASEEASIQETISSLEFATRAKKIKNKVVANTELSAEILQEKLKQTELELNTLRMYVSELESLTVARGLSLPKPGQFTARTGAIGLSAMMMTQRAPVQPQIEDDVDDELPRRVKAMSESHARRDSFDDLGVSGFTGHLKQKFTDKVQMLTKRRSRMSADGTPSVEQAMHLALTPSILEEDKNDLTEELNSQIVNLKAEIEALNAEIEAIYTLVLAHEDEVVKVLETKNLEILALRVQTNQAGSAPPVQITRTTTQQELQDPSRALKNLQATKNGARLMTETTFKNLASDDEMTPRRAAAAGLKPKSDNFNILSQRLAYQSQAIDDSKTNNNNDAVAAEEGLVVLQQTRIRELENLVSNLESENERYKQEQDKLKSTNSELQLQIATLRQSIRVRQTLGQARQQQEGGSPQPRSFFPPRDAVLRRSASDVAQSALDVYLAGGHQNSFKVVRPIVPKKRLNEQAAMNPIADESDQEDLPDSSSRQTEEESVSPDSSMKSTPNVSRDPSPVPSPAFPLPSPAPSYHAPDPDFQKALLKNDIQTIVKMMNPSSNTEQPSVPVAAVVSPTPPSPVLPSPTPSPPSPTWSSPHARTPSPIAQPLSLSGPAPFPAPAVPPPPPAHFPAPPAVAVTHPSLNQSHSAEVNAIVKMMNLAADPKWKRISGGAPTVPILDDSTSNS